jgi:hypothetical protein
VFVDGPHQLFFETGAPAQPPFGGRLYAETTVPDATGTVEETAVRCVIPPQIRVNEGDILHCLTHGSFEGRYRVTSVLTATARHDPHHCVLSLVELPPPEEEEEEVEEVDI